MFSVLDNRVILTRGDSALLTLHVRTKYRFTSADRAIFMIRGAHGGPLLARCTLTLDERGWTQIPLTGEITKHWLPGIYEWEVRLMLDATLDEEGNVIDERKVIRPMRPRRFEVLRAAGKRKECPTCVEHEKRHSHDA